MDTNDSTTTTDETTHSFFLASIPRRFLALLLDALILAIPSGIVEHILPAVGSFVLTFFYFTLFDSSIVRGTPGKYLMGIQIVDMAASRISFRTAVVRYFMKIISGMMAMLGFAIAFFTEKKQTLHDLIAETVVVYGRNETSLMNAWWDQARRVFAAAGPQGRADAFHHERDKLAELERLQALREKGALTEEEFLEQKKKLLS